MDRMTQTGHNADPVMLYLEKHKLIHIVTDRTVHKPGDKIRFRILVLDDNLLPQNLQVRLLYNEVRSRSNK